MAPRYGISGVILRIAEKTTIRDITVLTSPILFQCAVVTAHIDFCFCVIELSGKHCKEAWVIYMLELEEVYPRSVKRLPMESQTETHWSIPYSFYLHLFM